MTAILLGSVGVYAATPTLNTFYASVWSGGGGGGGSGDEHHTGSKKRGGSGGRGGTGSFGEIKIEGLNADHRLKFVVGSGGNGGSGGSGYGTGGTGGGLSSLVLSDVDGTKNETLIAMGGGGGGGGGQDGASHRTGSSGGFGHGALSATTSATASAGGTGIDDGGSGGAGGASFAVTAVLDGTYNSTVHSGVVVTLLANEAGEPGSFNPRGDTNHFSATNDNVGTGGSGAGSSDGSPGFAGKIGKIVYGFSTANTTTQTTELLVDPTTLTGAE